MTILITSNTALPKWLRLMRAEYTEMPGLHLTKWQVQRLWGLDASTTDVLLSELIQERFLCKTPTGAYVRAERHR